MTGYRVGVMAGVVVLAALARLAPHPPNFAPVTALALFAAATMRPWWLGLTMPVAAMFLSDAALQVGIHYGWLDGWLAGGTGFYHWTVIIYLTVAAVAGVGFLLRDRIGVASVALATVGGSLLFFGVTNLFVWSESLFGGPLAMYAPTWDGLVECYAAAVPFYRTALVGDLFYCGVLFGGLALAEKLAPHLVREALPVRDSAE
ncbi:MAG: DUF6580 family putative transport protein [Gemmataceae bacterium]